MRVVVTCGPSYEPIDEVRRITNFSTGELGVRLANRLAADGHEVTCFRGVAATSAVVVERARQVSFSTNADLLEKLSSLELREDIGAVFHAAALADFAVKHSGPERKLSSRGGEIVLTLVPAPKLIGRLRPLFPKAWLVGWKYELDGAREEVIARGARQVAENAADACVLNGDAYGPGFGVLRIDGSLTHLTDRAELCEYLAGELSRQRSAQSPAAS